MGGLRMGHLFSRWLPAFSSPFSPALARSLGSRDHHRFLHIIINSLSLTHLHTHTQSLFSTVLALLLLLLMQRNTAIRKIPSPRRRRRHPSVEQNKKTRKCIISDANKKMARNYLFLHSHQLKKKKKVGFKYESRVNVDYSRESRES